MHESGEMYLETILLLADGQSRVRATDVADRMNLTKASVSKALSRLRDEGFITVSPDGSIAFTESGKSIAVKIYERHHVLTDLLVSFGVSGETAARDACKIEHDISDESFSRIKEHMSRKAPGPEDTPTVP